MTRTVLALTVALTAAACGDLVIEADDYRAACVPNQPCFSTDDGFVLCTKGEFCCFERTYCEHGAVECAEPR